MRGWSCRCAEGSGVSRVRVAEVGGKRPQHGKECEAGATQPRFGVSVLNCHEVVFQAITCERARVIGVGEEAKLLAADARPPWVRSQELVDFGNLVVVEAGSVSVEEVGCPVGWEGEGGGFDGHVDVMCGGSVLNAASFEEAGLVEAWVLGRAEVCDFQLRGFGEVGWVLSQDFGEFDEVFLGH
jgi:hypothetical protein